MLEYWVRDKIEPLTKIKHSKNLYHENTKLRKHEKLNSSLFLSLARQTSLTWLAALGSTKISFFLKLSLFFRAFVLSCFRPFVLS
jgi:hypothetical protein